MECWAQKKKGEKVVFLQQIFQSDHFFLVDCYFLEELNGPLKWSKLWECLTLRSSFWWKKSSKVLCVFFLKCTRTHTIMGFQWSLDSCRGSPPKSNRLLAYHSLWYFCNKRCLIILWCGSFHKTLPWSISNSCYWLISFFSLALGYLHRI